MSEEIKRGPGRPKSAELKKGNSAWKPASATDVINKEDGYHYRWVNKDPDVYSKRIAEGYEPVSKIQADSATPTVDNRIENGKSLTSVHEKKDLILCRTPQEIADSRTEYFNNETERRTAGLTAHVKRDMREKGGGAEVHGNITISSRKGEHVIE